MWSPPTPEEQVLFLRNIQRLLAEGQFVASYKRRFGIGPNPNADYTEAFCAQWLDTETLQPTDKKVVDSI